MVRCRVEQCFRKNDRWYFRGDSIDLEPGEAADLARKSNPFVTVTDNRSEHAEPVADRARYQRRDMRARK